MGHHMSQFNRSSAAVGVIHGDICINGTSNDKQPAPVINREDKQKGRDRLNSTFINKQRARGGFHTIKSSWFRGITAEFGMKIVG